MLAKKTLQRPWTGFKSECTNSDATSTLKTRLSWNCTAKGPEDPKIDSLIHQIASKNNPEGVLRATSTMQANLDEFGSPNLGKCPKFGTPNASPNAPRIHSLGDLEATSHPSLVLGSFLMHFQWYFHAKSVDKSVQNAALCEHQFLNWLFISEQMMQRFLQKLESIKTLGGLFKNRRYDW